MKRNIFFILLLIVSVLSACGSDSGSSPESDDTLSCSAEALNLDATGSAVSLTVSSSREWGLKVSDSWIKTSVSAGLKGETVVSVSADSNPTSSQREGTITIFSGANRATVKVTQVAGAQDVYNTPDGYELVWHDEFNEGSALNSADWTHEVQSSGWVNNELQNYVNQTSPGGKNVTEIKDGNLCINCFKENGNIYSGRVYAHVNTGWLYGYFEARILLPKGKGTWPAFWMMPVNNDFSTNPWPNCGEIDIMEEVGCVPNEVSSSIHTKSYNHTINTQKTQKRNIGTAESEYHVYACEWTKDRLRFYVDGAELLTFDNEGTGKDAWPFTYAFYPILNLAWGGSWGGMNGVDESALPVTMKVDYIRVFQKK